MDFVLYSVREIKNSRDICDSNVFVSKQEVSLSCSLLQNHASGLGGEVDPEGSCRLQDSLWGSDSVREVPHATLQVDSQVSSRGDSVLLRRQYK